MSDERLKRMEDKIDKVVDSINKIDKTLAAQHVSLEIHIKRTDLLEKKLEPVERHVSMVNGAFKLLILIGVLVGIYKALR